MKKIGLIIAISVFLFARTLPAQVLESERAAVMATVQQFLDAIAERDAGKALKAVIPDGRVYSVRVEAGKPLIRTFTFQEDIAKWQQGCESFLERIWDSEVRIHECIATVWTPYDFYRNGHFSHCGMDVFNLLKTADGWRLNGLMYTVEQGLCPKSPLGPPSDIINTKALARQE